MSTGERMATVLLAIAPPVFLALLVWTLVGCTAAELDHYDPQTVKDPPCNAQSPFLCPGSHECCTSDSPVCMGPDATGYYCQPQPTNVDDPQHFFGAHPRRHAVRRVDQ